MTFFLHGLGHSHPDNEITNQFLESLDIGTTDSWIMDRVGIRSRRTVMSLDYIKHTKNSDPRAALESRTITQAELGERAARHVGLDVERLRLVAIVLVALLVGCGVAFVGIIAFVGLIVPHVVRMLIGPAHRTLVPASILGGAVVMVLADLVARTAVDYADLPIGMLTALVGGPFFFWLIRRERSNSGGWA